MCVNELDDDWNDKDGGQRHLDSDSHKSKSRKQLYRIDIPLKVRKELKAERISMAYLINLGEKMKQALQLQLQL